MNSQQDSAGAPDFAPGTRVLAAVKIGGLFRARVPRDTLGVVIAGAPGGLLEVHFDQDRTELVRPDQLLAFRGFFDQSEGS
jgi:hypothetical protein